MGEQKAPVPPRPPLVAISPQCLPREGEEPYWDLRVWAFYSRGEGFRVVVRGEQSGKTAQATAGTLFVAYQQAVNKLSAAFAKAAGMDLLRSTSEAEFEASARAAIEAAMPGYCVGCAEGLPLRDGCHLRDGEHAMTCQRAGGP